MERSVESRKTEREALDSGDATRAATGSTPETVGSHPTEVGDRLLCSLDYKRIVDLFSEAYAVCRRRTVRNVTALARHLTDREVERLVLMSNLSLLLLALSFRCAGGPRLIRARALCWRAHWCCSFTSAAVEDAPTSTGRIAMQLLRL